jgi:hypothetical protein
VGTTYVDGRWEGQKGCFVCVCVCACVFEFVFVYVCVYVCVCDRVLEKWREGGGKGLLTIVTYDLQLYRNKRGVAPTAPTTPTTAEGVA